MISDRKLILTGRKLKLKHRLLTWCLLLPLLAGADPLNNGALAFLFWAALLVVAYCGLLLVPVFVAVRHPRRLAVQVLQGLGLLPVAWFTPSLTGPSRATRRW